MLVTEILTIMKNTKNDVKVNIQAYKRTYTHTHVHTHTHTLTDTHLKAVMLT